MLRSRASRRLSLRKAASARNFSPDSSPLSMPSLSPASVASALSSPEDGMSIMPAPSCAPDMKLAPPLLKIPTMERTLSELSAAPTPHLSNGLMDELQPERQLSSSTTPTRSPRAGKDAVVNLEVAGAAMHPLAFGDRVRTELLSVIVSKAFFGVEMELRAQGKGLRVRCADQTSLAASGNQVFLTESALPASLISADGTSLAVISAASA